ncbi:MAG: alpha-amylase family glycosyl hydrolase [Saprospiraceae bacterium]
MQKGNLTAGFNDAPPQWAREAIWYQIFVERFRRGNKKNDPTQATCDKALIDPIPGDWSVTPWSHNWYAQEDWAKNTGLDFYRTVQMRRYGGDLDGVIEKIPYLVDLGITAVYFNPLNDAPSLHKYDVRHYHHIDITFGDDPDGDSRMMQTEQPDDPTTWLWTSADLKFLQVVRLLHSHNIKVIVDFSWNHTGITFWAFKDLNIKLSASNYKEWYNIQFVKDQYGNKEQLLYSGWEGISTLPELKKMSATKKVPGKPYEGNLSEPVKKHIFDVCMKWMDPHGDGTCRDGIDGMRLDVAEHIPLGFWRELRKFVKNINSEFYMVGENWWEQWPHKLMDTTPWVNTGIFDAVMHYQWFKLARGFFLKGDDAVSLEAFKFGIDGLFKKFPLSSQQAMMNVAASHDTPRIWTSFQNRNVYKYKCKPSEDAKYNTKPPSKSVEQLVKLFLLHQFTFIGAPHIWNGDEMGMVGADDPDNRKPLWWDDIVFEPETAYQGSAESYTFIPEVKNSYIDFYKRLIGLRKENPVLSQGDYSFFDGETSLLIYSRKTDIATIFVIINTQNSSQQLPQSVVDGTIIFCTEGRDQPLNGTMPPMSGIVIQQ